MVADLNKSPVIIGVSLKMYFGHQQTIDWCRRVSQIAATHQATKLKKAQIFVLPSLPSIGLVSEYLKSSGIGYGAQDMYHEDKGAFTGEVGGEILRELGCDYVEIGHAERRKLFGETDEVISAKVAAAVRNGLTPVLCVGESEHVGAQEAAELCIKQIEKSGAATDDKIQMLVAYEPVWAIGATKPASKEHIIQVCERLTQFLDSSSTFSGSRVIYGGSAGPGLLTELDGRVNGMFLGRFVHNPENLIKILDEVLALQAPLSVSA